MDSNWRLIADSCLGGEDPEHVKLKNGDLVGYRWITTSPGRGRARVHFIFREVETPDIRLDRFPLGPHNPRYELIVDQLATEDPIRSFQQRDGDILIYRYWKNHFEKSRLLRVERLREGEVELFGKEARRRAELQPGGVSSLPDLDLLKQIMDRQDDRGQQIADLRGYAEEYRRTGELPLELGNRLDHWADLLAEH